MLLSIKIRPSYSEVRKKRYSSHDLLALLASQVMMMSQYGIVKQKFPISYLLHFRVFFNRFNVEVKQVGKNHSQTFFSFL